MSCHFYNDTLCNGNSEGNGCSGNGSIECKIGESSKGNVCYTLFQNHSHGYSVKLKGCWVGNNPDCNEKTSCEPTIKDGLITLYFCCCTGEMCNSAMELPQLLLAPPIEKPSHPTTNLPIQRRDENSQVLNTLIYTVVPIVVVVGLIGASCFIYRRQRMAHFNELPTSDPSPLPPSTPTMGLRPIQLLEVKAHGRFGAVWKAQMLTDLVAVKVFPPQDKISWMVEQEIYRLAQMKHPNILYYIGAEKRGENLQAEYWLITLYHERGSLCDYLKANLISWPEVLLIADSIAKGLMHLHEELPPTKGELYKPAIAHRDFKSKNVLLKSDMSACIADFGLALVFHQGHPPGDTHGQVGTRRYMAPEVLEGAISFNRDSFLRIDMYACGLVLWELLSRCSIQEGPVEEYMLPFEEEIGQHPTLEDMQELVVHKKARPKFKDQWKKHNGLGPLCDTIEECWDHDADARLSASCVQERLAILYKTPIPTSASTTTLSTEIKTSTSNQIPTLVVKTSVQTMFQAKESSI